MNWHVTAGIAQLILVALFLATQFRATQFRATQVRATQARSTQVRSRRRPVGELLLYGLPMIGLAVGTLVGATWAVVVAAVFYSVWLVNHLLSWRPRPAAEHAPPGSAARGPGRLPAAVRAAVGVVSLAVLALTWCAVAASAVPPLG